MERVKYNRVEVSHGNTAKKFPVYEIYLDGVIISGIYGMNVGGEWMPFAKTPFGFEIISGIILLICIIVLWVLRKKKML